VNDRFDERLGSTLERRANSITGAPAFSADDLVRMGRQTARRRTWIAATASVAALVAIGVPVAVKAARGQDRPAPPASTTPAPSATERHTPPTDCTIERLPVPSGASGSLVMAMDPTGRYIVGRSGSAAGFELLRWDNGAVQRVALPGENPVPTDVNADGVVVGSSNRQPWVYRGSAVLPLPGANATAAHAISDGGVVVGVDNQFPALWRALSAEPTRLAVPAGTEAGRASDISPDGRTIVGTLTRQNTSRAYIWLPDGTARELPLPVITGETVRGSSANAISGDWVFGSVSLPTTSVSARWNLRTGEMQTFQDFRAPGVEISDDGLVVGSDKLGRPIVRSGTSADLLLPSLPARAGGAAATDKPKTISGNGRVIAGDAATEAGSVPVIWRCR
jgi:uncharacterized membrane protein